jgi:steroid delta-isomerase-like uncharacterized protein
MLQEEKVTLGGIVTAFNQHDAAAFAAHFAPDGIVRIVPTADSAQGQEQIEAFVEPDFHAFPDSQLERRDVYDCAEGTWIEWTITGTHAGEFMGHPATHRGFELYGCSRFTFTHDGLIAEEALYFDPLTILRQLGLIHDDQRVT